MGREIPQQVYIIIGDDLVKDALRRPAMGFLIYVTIVTCMAWFQALQLDFAFVMRVPSCTLAMAFGMQGAKSSSILLLICC